MKKIILKISGIVLSMTILATTAFADDIPPSGTMPISKIVANIYAQGYGGINEVKYDDGVYKAKVINKDGQEQNLYIDPTTGTVPAQKSKVKQINMIQAIKNVPKDRCKTITKIENSNGAFKVECLDSNNQEVNVVIDAISGKVSQVRYDD
ncbi:PepSY domain-containing protein [Francisella sp. LA112445]|uniref:PepSY domain-containing protein n=1 Tax=Francisella sp. LA112445 TaxID=1395624 RepID=UPI001788D3D5|nr:PepSY domain-containing protein [Francisella sp. LA112445]QIW10874.1 PepSY domain-containing protein [Francisella sp. LA112445]